MLIASRGSFIYNITVSISAGETDSQSRQVSDWCASQFESHFSSTESIIVKKLDCDQSNARWWDFFAISAHDFVSFDLSVMSIGVLAYYFQFINPIMRVSWRRPFHTIGKHTNYLLFNFLKIIKVWKLCVCTVHTVRKCTIFL